MTQIDRSKNWFKYICNWGRRISFCICRLIAAHQAGEVEWKKPSPEFLLEKLRSALDPRRHHQEFGQRDRAESSSEVDPAPASSVCLAPHHPAH